MGAMQEAHRDQLREAQLFEGGSGRAGGYLGGGESLSGGKEQNSALVLEEQLAKTQALVDEAQSKWQECEQRLSRRDMSI